MTTSALATGHIVRALRRAMRDHLDAALEAVEASYAVLAQTEPDVELLPLVPPVAITRGFDELATKRPITDFPRVAILVGPRAPTGAASDQRLAEAVHTPMIEWQCAGSTPDEAMERTWRYGEALLAVLIDQAPYAGFDLESIAPPVDEGLATVLAYKPNTQIPMAYLAGATVTVALKGLYVR